MNVVSVFHPSDFITFECGPGDQCEALASNGTSLANVGSCKLIQELLMKANPMGKPLSVPTIPHLGQTELQFTRSYP